MAIPEDAQREKWWNELTDLEKIERMHNVVKSLSFRIEDLEARLGMFDVHEHSKGSQQTPLVPPNFAWGYSERPMEYTRGKPGEGYF